MTQTLLGRRMPEGISFRTYLRLAVHDGVPRVVPALAAHDDVRGAGEHVDDLALAFVSPLRSHENDVGHKTLMQKNAEGR